MDTTITQVGPMAFVTREPAESEARVLREENIGMAQRIEIANVQANVGLM